MRSLVLGVLVIALCSCASCAGARPQSCASNVACKNGDVCVVGACTSGGSPVAANARRIVVDPEGIAYVTSASGVDVRSASIALGASIGGGARILVKFARGDWGADRVTKAYLVLELADGAEAGPGEIVLRAEKILEAWSPRIDGKGTSWSSPPRSEPIPGGEAHVTPRGPSVVRIDVTPYAIDLAKPTVRAFGLRIEGDGAGFGAPIATGLGGGHAPRLEVYVNP